MTRWDPDLYLGFGDLRLRPALELFARVDHPAPSRIHDVGTGAGEMARLFARRWPDAAVTGSDTSAEMLATAAATESPVRWVRADAAEWDPPEPPDIVFSNAALHWIGDHDDLFARLARSLAPGGVLAVQMPLSWSLPSHESMRTCLETAGPGGSPVGSAALREGLARQPVGSPEMYHDLLSPLVADVDIWTTTYLQALDGDDPVLDWVSGTALRPVLADLEASPDERERFLDAYRRALRDAYPRQPDGTTLYPFTRLFIVARRGD